MVVAGEVAHHDDPAEHGHVLEDGGGELASNTIEKNVDTIWGSNVKCLVDILSLVVKSPVQIEVRLDPGGFVSVSCVA